MVVDGKVGTRVAQVDKGKRPPASGCETFTSGRSNTRFRCSYSGFVYFLLETDLNFENVSTEIKQTSISFVMVTDFAFIFISSKKCLYETHRIYCLYT